MPLAQEPCLYKYFIFLVKEKGKLHLNAINDAQMVWDKLCRDYSLENKTQKLIEAIEKSSEEIFLDKRIKRLGTTKTNGNQVLGGQILAHDMLILCFVINSPKKHSTDTPNQDWEQQLEINIIADESSNIYSHGTVFQTITNSPQQVLDITTSASASAGFSMSSDSCPLGSTSPGGGMSPSGKNHVLEPCRLLTAPASTR